MKNNLEISFDYHKPDIAVLTVFKTSNAFLYTMPSVQIIRLL